MSFVLNTHRPTEAASTEISLDVIPFNTEYGRAKSSDTRTSVNSVSAGRVYPSTLEFESRQVQNVYNNTHLASSPQRAVNKTGTRVYVQNKETWSKTSTEDLNYEVLFPANASLQFIVPNDETITTEVVLALLDRTYAAARSRVTQLLIGITNPID